MSALLDEQPTANTSEEPARRLRSEMTAVRLSFTWFGTRKTLTNRQKARAAESFGAEGGYLSAGKKLLDTNQAEATGESRSEIARRGFSPLEPVPEEPEALIIDWDLVEQNRNCALFRAAS